MAKFAEARKRALREQAKKEVEGYLRWRHAHR
jgi:hypothetical protein